ncbi:MAG: response regulator [Thermoanaerobaculia bacterium]
MSSIRVLCVDDHPLVREAIAQKIAMQSDMQIVGLGSNGRDAVELYRKNRPDVTLMDLQLPIMSGLDAIRAIQAEESKARIIVLTMYDGDDDIYRALRAGATTYLLKNTLSDDLVRVVREVHAGRSPMPTDVATRLADHTKNASLTSREIEVVELMAGGKRNKEIAAALGIQNDTVEAHLRNIYVKLKVNDRTAAVTVALRRGFIHLPFGSGSI